MADGLGGGALILNIETDNGAFRRGLWFGTAGRSLATNDSQGTMSVLRVTTRSCTFQQEPPGSPEMLVKFRKGRTNVTVKVLGAIEGSYEEENLSAAAVASPDRLGFFTTQKSPTNIIVRRYNY